MRPINKSWYKKWWGVLLIIIIAFTLTVLTAFAFYVLSIVKQIKQGGIENAVLRPNAKVAELTKQDRETIEGKDNYRLGPANPKVTIVEFADFACPYSRKSYSKIREISVKYKDSVKVIYRDFPIRQEYSLDLAMAGRCAGEQGLFWMMHDRLFQNQGVNKTEELIELANQIGADIDKFNNCLRSGKYASLIQKDIDDARELGLTGTPTWFINGYKVEGDIPYDIFINIIEKLLNS